MLCVTFSSQVSGAWVPPSAGGIAILHWSLSPVCRNATSQRVHIQLEKLSATCLSNSPQVSAVLPVFLHKATVMLTWSYGKNKSRIGGRMLNTALCVVSLYPWYFCCLSLARWESGSVYLIQLPLPDTRSFPCPDTTQGHCITIRIFACVCFLQMYLSEGFI